jgi:hypothetical protein
MKWDFFISHASEDKPLIAAPLAHYLTSASFNTWYDEFNLNVGDHLTDTINRGLESSAFGVVVLSPLFLSKNWPQYELETFLRLETEQRSRVLPVWHQIGATDLQHRFPQLADRKAADTKRGLQAVAEELVKASMPDRVKDLPLNNTELTQAKQTEVACAELRRILDSDLDVGYLRLLISAYPIIVSRTIGYAPRLIPAFKFPCPFDCDFAIATPEGITGTVVISFVVLGAKQFNLVETEKLIMGIDTSLGWSRKRRDRRPYFGMFSSMTETGRSIRSLLDSENINWRNPATWSISVIIITGRRGQMSEVARDDLRWKFGIPIECASYDRLLDNARSIWR